MQYEFIITKIENQILIITINREKAMNALNAGTLDELDNVFKTEEKNTDLKGVIITGAGEKAFVAGADISQFTNMKSEQAIPFAQRGQQIFRRIETFPKPVIAAVNGFALGGGCELAMACHMRVAGESAKFGQPEVNLGIIPGYGGTQRLIQLIGKGKAIELLMTGDMLDAAEAKMHGLVNHVVPSGEEVEKAVSMIEKIAKKAPVAIAQIVDCVDAFFDKNRDGMAVEIENFGLCADTSDFQEGATAFLERRKADFKGH